MTEPQLFWDWGTAYDLFISLEVLHEPAKFGVRGAWAAGVRARLPPEARETLEQVRREEHPEFHWVYGLPEPKDGVAALWALRQLAPVERLLALFFCPCTSPRGAEEILRQVAARENWEEQDRQALRAAWEDLDPCMEYEAPPSPERLAETLEWWAGAEELGERYTEALGAYYEVFFAEEERRIRPALQDALSQAQERAKTLPLLDLLEELSQGLRFDERPTAPELVLAPSYWCSPLMYFGHVSPEREILLFGGRPPDASLVPGEVVPDAMLRVLKALSDPTRLRILNYLSEEPLTPSELARRLRLRAPTVIHHLKTLRLAGLVQFSLGADKEDRRYAARPEAVERAWEILRGFLGENRPESPEENQTQGG
jgi:DNA-binding transcriptional ArsR family regulator